MIHTYTIAIKRVPRSRSIKIKIARLDEIRVSAPKRASKKEILGFIERERDWIRDQMEKLRARQTLMAIVHTDSERARLSKIAREIVHTKLEYFAKKYGYRYNKVAIRNQISRWGSCSSSGNLNFNYRIALLPEELQDYLIVHELCHLREMNHSSRFWRLVEQEIPDYKSKARRLKSFAL